MSDYETELRRKAHWIVCPWCDEDVCVGREDCVEIKRFIEKALKERKGE